jgi:hypothetical protein
METSLVESEFEPASLADRELVKGFVTGARAGTPSAQPKSTQAGFVSRPELRSAMKLQV